MDEAEQAGEVLLAQLAKCHAVSRGSPAYRAALDAKYSSVNIAMGLTNLDMGKPHSNCLKADERPNA